ncbi:hypothetical protein [Methylosinus sp. Sm6]|uniref:hypothetical protein n=1 Tax=Methylosinus sp. Sm6 TaxID=2866948 RepID=UPI001C99E843|nr:hypothetical protein [Methylosinus sp. Sm6]MBY6242598.1 hypothetical protein [Methylosinus sp. Sm6]
MSEALTGRRGLSTVDIMAKPRPSSVWSARALVATVLAALLQQLLVPGFAGYASGAPTAYFAALCHAAQSRGDAPAQPGPTPGHCAFCPCLTIVDALPPTVTMADALAPPVESAAARLFGAEAPAPPAGCAAAWSSRAPPLA